MKYGLFGGTFDPVHFGHLRCAQEILEMLALDKICFIPSARPAFKKHPDLTFFADRFRMVELAISENASFEVTDLENRREGISYAVDTVEELLRTKDMEPYFILGQDAFEEIRKWKSCEALLATCHFVIMTRPGYTEGNLERALPRHYAARYKYVSEEDAYCGPAGKKILFRKVTLLDISSTDIRKRIGSGKSVRYLVPDTVREYIKNQKLYSAS